MNIFDSNLSRTFLDRKLQCHQSLFQSQSKL